MTTLTDIPRKTTKGTAFLIEDSEPQDIFTPEDLSEEHLAIGKMVEEFWANEVEPNLPAIREKKPGVAMAVLRKSVELGLTAMAIPEEYGGMAMDLPSLLVTAERLGRDGSYGGWHSAHTGIGTLPVVYFGTPEQKRKYLPKLAKVEMLAAYALTEPLAGSDALAARTRADLAPDGKHYILNGQKMWITNGGFADLFVVFAKIDGERFSAFIVEKKFPGCKPGNEEHKMGIHGSSTTPVFLENCQVPKENLLHEIGRGHIVAFNILNAGRFSLGAYCTGGAKGSLETASKYAKERVAFGKPIGDFGLIREKLGEMAIRIFAVESMIYRSAGLMDRAIAAAGEGADKSLQSMKVFEEFAIESSISKVYGSELLDFVVDEAVQIFGGYGFHEDYPVARSYRDSRVNRIFEGTNEINRMLIIQMLMKRATSGALPLMQAGAKLREEIMAGPSFEEPPGGEWAAEERILAGLKKAFLLVAGAALEKYREHLADQQEIVAALSDVVMECYAVESSLRRVQKAELARGATSTAVMADAARVFLHDAADRVEVGARRALAAVLEGDMLRTQLAVLRRFLKREPADTVAMRQRVCAAVQAGDRYPFEGR